ncbi:DUF2750 domain-containing protein [Thalassotalea litorea]|uniref:DUF2750 domain-containing protein n=1 Tax=Thalassotalea litorea TaxID=2020715 RepID=A0A5R9IPA5_9GAMM|nr:DUF2750 domain-containing protein [Thalassotalea litorea]TLU66303.1 DUF2750 domain-containing protein [Thalassotalea litorea]
MSKELEQQSLKLSAEQRFELFMNRLMSEQQAWILTDEHGCVMLTDGDEDLVPFWPSEETARHWASEEWSKCQPKVLSFDELIDKWLPGMEEDELAMIIFPADDLQGRILHPWEFAQLIKKKQEKLARKN